MRISDWSSDVCSSDLIVVNGSRCLACASAVSFLTEIRILDALSMFNLADYGTDPNEIVVTAEPKPKQGPPDCPSGPRIVFGSSFGGTAFAGVGERARGGSLKAGVGHDRKSVVWGQGVSDRESSGGR